MIIFVLDFKKLRNIQFLMVTILYLMFIFITICVFFFMQIFWTRYEMKKLSSHYIYFSLQSISNIIYKICNFILICLVILEIFIVIHQLLNKLYVLNLN